MKAFDRASRYGIHIVSVLAITLMACTKQIASLTSETGRSACLRQIAIELPMGSQQEKQAAYRDCLDDIDQKLEQSRLEEKNKKAQMQIAKELAEDLKRQSWATTQERIMHCKFNQQTIIELDKRYTRAYARLLNANNQAGLSQAEKVDRQRALDAIQSELATLIPERMRAGKPLIPDSLQTFKTCKEDLLQTTQ